MKFERLRLAGFKTFVDPTDLVIAAGLTGIVGPNGCGKSNLVEALRWVMGETSSKSLRGAGMDDVIFAGSGTRPERNHAEVSIRILDPPSDLAGHLHGVDQLDISRKITRDAGSTYRINGRETRARDVQILFADAASGARSPSLVRQGQISEIIAAKPQHRRRILEDAAGVAGLHARRHEAELRLKQAEENLNRAEDVLTSLDKQIGDLKRQAKQAERYKTLAAEIRVLELALLSASLERAGEEAKRAQAAHHDATRAIAIAMVAQGEAERARALTEHALETGRARAHEAAQTLRTLLVARDTLDAERKQVEARLVDITTRQSELARDRDKAAQVNADAEAAQQRLRDEATTLKTQLQEAQARLDILDISVNDAAKNRNTLEAALFTAQNISAERAAMRRTAEHRVTETAARLARFEAQHQQAKSELATLMAADPSMGMREALQSKLDQAIIEVEKALTATDQSEASTREARNNEQTLRPRLAEAERSLQRLETEARTIRKLVENVEPGLWTPAIDKITVQPGFEAALAAALGDDLEAALELSAPRFWSDWDSDVPSPGLPQDVASLLNVVQAPKALSRRLSQIGLVTRIQGAELCKTLAQGQRLVSKEGDLWRWDGFTRKAEAPSAAARRLAERNRLSEIERDADTARTLRDDVRSAMDQAIRALKSAQDAEGAHRDAARRLGQHRDQISAELQREMRRSQEAHLKLESAKLRIASLEADITEARSHWASAQSVLDATPVEDAGADLVPLQNQLHAARHAENTARAERFTLDAKRSSGQQRLASIADEDRAWQERAARAAQNVTDYAERATKLAAEDAALEERPAQLAAQRRSLTTQIEAAEQADRDAQDGLALAETAFRKAEETARAAFQALASTRETAVRLEALFAHAQDRLTHVTTTIEAEIGAPVRTLATHITRENAHQGLTIDQIEARLFDLKHDRDRLGAVNLRADLELTQIEGERGNLAREREEITEAIRRFRRAIDALNSEGRARLRVAFDSVNTQFARLFTQLFGGGTAELKLVEADDPLEAGLDILAHPPGKKPQLLSLLSGGEQALTATALIFAVFLTNPSPICVLDEVDAPLDDSNVERLCDLLTSMAQETATRFLVITHNPISMARMDRLYGVTMVERGVSQLVSVDLAAAEKLVEAV